MVVGHFYDDLFWPDLLVHELLAVEKVQNEVDRAFEQEGLVLGEIECKEEGILGPRIQTEGQGPFLLPGYTLRINKYFLHTEPIPLTRINQGNPKLFNLQQPIILNNNL